MLKLLAPAALAAALLCAPAEAAAGTYSFVTFDDPAADVLGTTITSINNHGAIAGFAERGNPAAPTFSAFTGQASGGPLTDITEPGSFGGGASGINDAGQIVGVTASLAGVRGFLRSPAGVYAPINPALGGLTSVYSEAVGINNAGVIVGYFMMTLPTSSVQQISHGFVRDAGGNYAMLDIPSALGSGTELYAVNDSGVISGSYLDAFGLPHGLVYTPGAGFSTLDPPGAFASLGGGLNDLGDFLANAATPDPSSPLGYDSSGYLYHGGVFTPFDVPGAQSTQLYGINDQGQITGLYVDATGIHGFAATPVPEPFGTAATGVAALAGLAGRRRRPPA